MRERYDPATKAWTVVLAMIVAMIVDWFAVVAPVQDTPARDPSMTWWWLAVAVFALPIVCWIVGNLIVRDGRGLVSWFVVAACLLGAQIALWQWAVS